MRTCLLVFLIIIWLPLALFSIWTTNFNLTLGKADFWLNNFRQIEGPQRLSSALSAWVESSLAKQQKPAPPEMTRAWQGLVEKVTTPKVLEQQLEGVLRGGELFWQGKRTSLPGLDLREIRQSILKESSLPKEMKQALLKDLPETFSPSPQTSQSLLRAASLSRLFWFMAVIVSLLFLLLIILLGQGLKGKLRTAGISLILVSLCLLLSLLAFSWGNQMLKGTLQQINLPLPALKELAQDFLTQVLNDLKSLPLKEGLIGLGIGIILIIVSFFLSPSSKKTAAVK